MINTCGKFARHLFQLSGVMVVLVLVDAKPLVAQTVINADTIYSSHLPNLIVSTTYQINDGVSLTGSGASTTGNGGLINDTAALTFVGSGSAKLAFINNLANTGGGALYSGGNISINGNYASILIDSNTTTVNAGGAFYVGSAGSINLSGTVGAGGITITNNRGASSGGAFYTGNNGSVNLNLITTGTLTMVGNAAGTGGVINSGSGISLVGSYGAILINSNTATVGNAGAFYNPYGDVVINATSGLLSISNNNGGAGNAGAIYSMHGNILLSGSYGGIIIDSNTTSGATYGGAFASGSNILISATSQTLQIRNNSVPGAGYGSSNGLGGAFNASGNIAISGSYGAVSIANNIGSGGAFRATNISLDGSYASLLIASNSLNSNGITGGAFTTFGGGISVTGSYGSISIENNSAVANTTANYGSGGAFYSAVDLVINTVTSGTMEISANYAKANGGAFYSGSNTSITGNYGAILIHSNTVMNTNGGAIYSTGNLNLDTLTTGTLAITNNAAKGAGGALISSSSVTISGTYGGILVDSNTSTGSGGAVYASKDISVYVQAGDLQISNNISNSAGGAFYTGGNFTLNGTANQLLMNSNTAKTNGAVVFNGSSGGILSINGTYGSAQISSNTAGSNGGAFYANGNIVINTLTDAAWAMTNNSAVNGGVLYSGTFGSIVLNGTYGAITIDSNKASSGAGGAFYSSGIAVDATSSGTLAITNNSAGNTTGGNGGAFYSANTINIAGSYQGILVDSNTTRLNGGAFYAAKGLTLNATTNNSLAITNNAVSGTGGAIFSGGNISIDGNYADMEISNNSAAGNGGAFYSAGSMAFNQNAGSLAIVGNTAGNQGGAFWVGTGFYMAIDGTQQFYNNRASSAANGGFLWINSGTAELNVTDGGLLELGNASSIANKTDSIGGAATSNVLQSNKGTVLYDADNSAYRGDFNLNQGVAQVSNILNLLGGKLNGGGILALDDVNAANGGNDFQFTATQAAGNFNGVVRLQNSSTYTISKVLAGGATEKVLQNSTLRLAAAGITADPADANGGMGVLVVNQDARTIGNLDLAGGKLVVYGKSPVTAESDVLNVKTLYSTAAGSVVAVDAAVLSGIDTSTGNQWVGPIFDLSSTLSRQIVNATVGVDPAVDGNFSLVDMVSGSRLTDIASYTFKNAGGSDDVGLIHVGYVAQVVQTGSMGLWVGTGVTEIDSTNANAMVNINSTQALNPGNQTLAARLSGDGAGFNFFGGNSITLANLSGDSDYTGTTAISGTTKVIAAQDNSLGRTIFLNVAGDGSQFDLNGKKQTIGGGYVDGNEALAGDGILSVIGGQLEITSANLGFLGDMVLGNSGTAGKLLLDNLHGDGDVGYIHFANAGSELILADSGTLYNSVDGAGTVTLLTGQDVFVTGTNVSFSGTFALNDNSVLRAASEEGLGSASVSAVSGSATLSLEAFNDTLANDLQGNLTLQLSDLSTVTINRANTKFSGSAIVDAGSQLIIQNEKAVNDLPITDNGLVTLAYSGNLNSVVSGSGDLQKIGSGNVTITTTQAYTGATRLDAGTLTAGVTDVIASSSGLNMGSNTLFDMNGLDQTIQSLSGSGTVNFGANNGAFNKLTINGNLNGDTAFKMRIAVGANVAMDSDKMYISGTAAGSHQVLIHNQGNTNTGSFELPMIYTGTTTGDFHGNSPMHQYNGALDIGMRSAQLQAGDLSGNDTNTWYLVLTNSATAANDTGSSNDGGVSGGDNAISDVGHGGHAVLCTTEIRYLTWFDQDTLVKRMGELRLNSVIFKDSNRDHDWEMWVRSNGSQYNVSGSGMGHGEFDVMIYGVDLGADKAWSIDSRNVLYTGVFGGYARADLDVNSGMYNTGGNDAYSVGFYGTWLHDSGWYADLVGKASYFDSNFHSYDESYNTTDGSYGSWAAGISLELGRQFQFKDGWFIEPQLQASYAHFFGANYQTTGDNQFAVNLGDTDVLQLRAGSMFGRTIKLSQDPKSRSVLQPYVKVFGMEQVSNGGKVTTMDGQWRPNTDGPGAIIGAGIIYQINETNQLHLDYEAAFADKYDKPFGINFGFRHQF